MHSMDFEYMAVLKEKLFKPGNGKGCVNVSDNNHFERVIFMNGMGKIANIKAWSTYGK